MATLTALILAKNEERHISECVASVAFADEVLVIDDFSTDETVALAQASGAKVITHALNGDWSQQRNFAVGEATGDWILFVDADERISPPLADEIRKVIHSGDMKAYE
ncbi:MAG: glycosyltransferase family 2 protein, partial [Megasphaera micronuciformis]|nr:glycosyltransferase family 2 protein [Megasphaera micronuciformis]